MSFPYREFPYTHVLQAQLRTGRGKPRVWFATSPQGQVVVKGPVQEWEKEGCRKSEALKQRLGLPHANMRIQGEYLVWDCLFDYMLLERQVASSPFDPLSEVPKKFHCSWDDSKLPTHALDILLALAFRKIAGAHDTCAQNFLLPPDGRVYSIDDPAIEKSTKFMWKNKVDPHVWGPILDTHWETVQARLHQWEKEVEGPMLERLHSLQTRKGWRWC